MKISAILDYAATPDEVFAMIADEDFQNRKCTATGALRHTVSIRSQDDRTIVRCTRDMPTDGLPSFVQSMTGESLAVTETQDWGPPEADGARRGTLTVEMGGAPMDLKGTLSLATGGQGSLETVEGELKATIPIIGRKIEQTSAPVIQSAIRVEGETGKAWLAGGQ